MDREYVLMESELQSAGAKEDQKFLLKRFCEARDFLEKGGTIRFEKEYSDGNVETVHVINSVDELAKLQEKYLP